MRNKTGMKEIAKRANVSITTVSNVMHGKRGKVSKNTYEKIEKIIEEEGYRLNVRATLLAGKRQLLFIILDFRKENERGDYGQIRKMVTSFNKKGIVTLLYFPDNIEEGIQFIHVWEPKGVVIIGEYLVKEIFSESMKECTVIRIPPVKNIDR